MKQEKGITLITLAITIIVMIILAGVSISEGINSIQSAKLTQFNAEMRIIHTRVNELVEELETYELELLGQAIPPEKASSVSTALGNESSNGFRYFNRTDLQNIGVSNIDREVIINFSTREVVDINGLEKGNTKIYRLADWTNMVYVNKNTEAPSFNLSKKVYDLNATILVENIEYKGNVGKGTVSYCTYNNATEGKWKKVAGTEIPVQVTGTYKVRLTDAAGNAAEKTVEVALANKPKLDSDMVPVVYGDNGELIETDETSGNWYDYSDVSTWAHAKDGENNIYVWVPRYMYNISIQNGNEIDIKFLKGITTLATDNTNVIIANSGENGTWNVHTAFNPVDTKLTGIWVKEISEQNSEKNDAKTKLEQYYE